MKISFITTVYNEEKTIDKFLDSLFVQTKVPDEVVIVDGGSTDQTVEKIKKQEVRFKDKNFSFKFFIKKGNRSVGRNEAIKKATGDVIVCSDSGNVLDKKWIEKIIDPFGSAQGMPFKDVDVVAGYYKGVAKNVFQKCLIPYVLVMPDKVDQKNFLPATRSIAFTKKIWKNVGGFDEQYSHNEDYVFANRLKEVGAKIVFAKDAIVNWIPRNTYKEAFIMFFRFAFGDAEAGIWRTKVLLLFARYFLVFYFIFLSLLYKSLAPLVFILISFIFYSIWSIIKNYRYVKAKEAFKILPQIQLTADAAVLLGTIIGLLKRIKKFNCLSYIRQNKFLFFITAAYIGIWLLIFKSGAPNQYHPFPYNMDEWHQLQAVRATFKYGTPNIFGAANGTMLHFMLSGLYLAPFTLIDYINPVVLKVNDLVMRERVFNLLRINTLIYGILSIFILYRIAGIIKVSKKIVLPLFVFTPIWFSLSVFFKYDIALMFWILLSILFYLRFWKNPTNQNYLLAAIPSALTLAVKVSALPIFVIYAFSYFWFHPQWKKNMKVFFAGAGLFVACVILFGLPDTLFGKGNIVLYFWENVIQAPATSSNYQLGMNPLLYVSTLHYPMIFGHGFMILFVVSVITWIYFFFKDGGFRNIDTYKAELFVFFSLLIFALSLVPLQIFGAANRSLVLLPFMVLIIAFVVKRVITSKRLKILAIGIVSFVVAIQILESFALIYIKTMESPQAASSSWIEKNIPKGRTIGIENIPIYQNISDVIQKEFYFEQYKIKQTNKYTYEIIDSSSKKLPPIIVITNDELELKFIKESPKKSLVQHIKREGYKKTAVFSPDLTLYKIFNKPDDYYLYSWLIAYPHTISVYVK